MSPRGLLVHHKKDQRKRSVWPVGLWEEEEVTLHTVAGFIEVDDVFNSVNPECMNSENLEVLGVHIGWS